MSSETWNTADFSARELPANALPGHPVTNLSSHPLPCGNDGISEELNLARFITDASLVSLCGSSCYRGAVLCWPLFFLSRYVAKVGVPLALGSLSVVVRRAQRKATSGSIVKGFRPD